MAVKDKAIAELPMKTFLFAKYTPLGLCIFRCLTGSGVLSGYSLFLQRFPHGR